MAAFIFSNLAGLIRQVLVAQAFGTQAEMESFNAANRVAETLFNLVAGGALASAFIPTFTSLLAKGDRDRAWKLASYVGNLVLLITILASILTAIFAPWIVRHILAPGFSTDPAKERLTVELMQLMLPSAVIFGLSGLVMGILNSNQIFFFPALAPAMYQAGMIFGVIALSPRYGIYGLAWGVVLGAGLHFLLQIPSLLKLKGNFTFGLGIDSPDVREVIRLMGPRLLGVAIVQLNFWINTRLASQFAEGSVTGVVLGFALMLMPQAAIAQSIAIAALPTFSAQVAQGRMSELRHSLGSSLRGAIVLSIPASVGLILLRTPLVRLLYERGQFDANSTELVSWALLWYSIGLVGHALVEILSRAFYSLHDTKTPVFVGIGAMSLNVGFSYLFTWLFGMRGWMPHGGLAFANTVATGLEASLLLLLMSRKLNGLEGKMILEGAMKAALAATTMGFGLWLWQIMAAHSSVWIEALGGILFGSMLFIITAFILKLNELRVGFGYLRKRLIP